MPQVRGIIRAVVFMPSAFLPPIEAYFECAHKILARQHRMLLVPDDPLAEVQPGSLQRRGVVAEVGIPAPDEKRPTGLEHTRGIGEPRQQHLGERFIADEVILQWPILRSHLFANLLRVDDPASLVDAMVIADILKPFADKDEQTKIAADQDGNRIVLLVPEPLLESIVNLVSVLDTPFEQDKPLLVPIEHLEAADLAETLEEFLTGSAQRTDRRNVDRNSPMTTVEGSNAAMAGGNWLVQFMVEPKLNVIVLRGRQEDVLKTVKLIEQLDIPTDIQTIGYELEFTSVQDVYLTLKEIVQQDQQRGGRGSSSAAPRLRLAASDQNNRIIVEGSAKDHLRISTVIKAIDKPLPPGSGGMRVYRLENASSGDVAKVLKDLISARSDLATQKTLSEPSHLYSSSIPVSRGRLPLSPCRPQVPPCFDRSEHPPAEA